MAETGHLRSSVDDRFLATMRVTDSMSQLSDSFRLQARRRPVLAFFLALASTASYAQPDGASPPLVAKPVPPGGPCTYKQTHGTVAVAAVLRLSTVPHVRFAFRPDNALEALRTDSDLAVEISDSTLPVGSTFAAVRSEIVSGSCIPIDYVATIRGRPERLSYQAAGSQ